MVPAFGVIEQVSSRKSNSTSFEAGAHEGELRKWCVPAGTKLVCPRWCETPEGQVCPHGLVLPQDRCVPTGCVKGDCRQWVAPAVGLGVWRNRISVVAEKQQRSRRGRGVSGAAATVVCPRWCGVSPLGALVGWLLRLRMRGGCVVFPEGNSQDIRVGGVVVCPRWVPFMSGGRWVSDERFGCSSRGVRANKSTRPDTVRRWLSGLQRLCSVAADWWQGRVGVVDVRWTWRHTTADHTTLDRCSRSQVAD